MNGMHEFQLRNMRNIENDAISAGLQWKYWTVFTMLILRNTVHNLNVVFLTCKACNEVSSSIRNLLDMDSFFRITATPHFKDITGEKTSPFLLF